MPANGPISDAETETRVLQLEACAVDLSTGRYQGPDRDGKLTDTETRLLAFLSAHPEREIERGELLEKVWGYAPTVQSRSADTAVRRLRKKIERDSTDPRHILTVQHVGYRFIPLKADPVGLGEVVGSSRPGTPTNLLAPRDTFVGRQEDLARLAEWVAEFPLVTVMGPAGMGKTRLAQRFGGLHQQDYAGGFWFCDLSGARDPEGVFRATATALGVPLVSRDPVGQLGDAIHGRGRVLIVLDNFEQVVEHADETVGVWLQRAPQARFVVTSRTTLGLETEHLFELSSLTVDHAIQLFSERARAARLDFYLTSETHPVVTELVERLDCLPLAVELAAARVRILAPQAILARMSRRFELLRGFRPDHGARQRTLRGAIDWSWDLLEIWEQIALVTCSVFRGGFTLEAAEAVIDLSDWSYAPPVIDVVHSLVEQSLLRAEEPLPGCARFRMYVSIQEYAAEKVTDSDALSAAEIRHAEYLSAFATESLLECLDTESGVKRRRALGLELDNLICAVDRAVARQDADNAARVCWVAMVVLNLTGPFPLGVALTDRVLSMANVDPEFRLRLLWWKGNLHFSGGWLEQGMTAWEQALALAQEVGSRKYEGILIQCLATIHRLQGRWEQAQSCFAEAMDIHKEVGSGARQASVLLNLGIMLLRQGQPGEAEAKYLAALALAREVGDQRLEGILLCYLGSLYLSQGQLDQAEIHMQAALPILQSVGDRREEGTVLGSLSRLHGARGRWQDAKRAGDASLAIQRAVGNRRSEGIIQGNLGDLALTLEAWDEAESRLADAVSVSDEMGSDAAGAFRASLALVKARQGDIEEARALLQAGEQQLRGTEVLELAKLLCKRARVERLAGDVAASEKALQEAEGLATELEVGPDSELGAAIARLRGHIDDQTPV